MIRFRINMIPVVSMPRLIQCDWLFPLTYRHQDRTWPETKFEHLNLKGSAGCYSMQVTTLHHLWIRLATISLLCKALATWQHQSAGCMGIEIGKGRGIAPLLEHNNLISNCGVRTRLWTKIYKGRQRTTSIRPCFSTPHAIVVDWIGR